MAPSYIYEDVNRGYFDFLAAVEGTTHEEVYAEKAAPTDLKRLASPQEVARATLFLASDLASAVTGADADGRLRRVPRLTMSDNVMTRERPDVGSYEDIVAAAVRTTGMSDFGDGVHEEGLRVLTEDLASAEAGLTPGATTSSARR